MGRNRFVAWMLVLLVLLTATGCSTNLAAPQGAAGKFKVALILVGPVGDAGWNASTYEGMRQLQQEQGFEFTYAEAVPFVESQAAIRDYASRGYNLIIANTFGYQDHMAAAAKDFPDTKFAVIAGRAKGPNLSSYDAGQRQATFLAGALAGLVSKTGTVGIVGGDDQPSIVKAVEGFKAGARHVRPDIKILTAYTGSFSDIAKAKETATAQIGSGADIVGHVANQAGLGVIQAAREQGVLAIGTGADQHAVAPTAVLTTAITDMKALQRLIVADAQSGSFGNQIVFPGIKEGVAYLAPFYELDPKVSPEIKQRLAALAEEIKAGKVLVPETSQKTE